MYLEHTKQFLIAEHNQFYRIIENSHARECPSAEKVSYYTTYTVYKTFHF